MEIVHFASARNLKTVMLADSLEMRDVSNVEGQRETGNASHRTSAIAPCSRLFSSSAARNPEISASACD